MPKIITPAMRAHLDAEMTRLAAIWRITRKDGAQFFFTDHDRDIVFAGEVYRADAGFERTAIRSDAGFAVDNLDLVGVFAEGGIVEDGRFRRRADRAELRRLPDQRAGRAWFPGRTHRGDPAVSDNLELAQVAAAQNNKETTINDQAGQLDAGLTDKVDDRVVGRGTREVDRHLHVRRLARVKRRNLVEELLGRDAGKLGGGRV
jgi:hypothetical protein